jgi:hypothetical protein
MVKADGDENVGWRSRMNRVRRALHGEQLKEKSWEGKMFLFAYYNE